MLKRVLTTVVGIPLLIFIVNQGGLLLFLSLLVVCSIGLWEYCRSVNTDENIKVNSILEILLGFFLLILFYFEERFLIPGIILSFITIFIHQIMQNKINILQGIYAFFGLIYITVFLGHILLFEQLASGTFVLWLVFIICFSTDTFAYIIGVNFGNHKLCPLISPKKSVEGAIGGVVGSIILTTIYGIIMTKYNLLDFPISYYIYLTFTTSILSQFGDLTASLLKRTFKVKDFGNLLPGHGGVLDRFDSVLFAAPVVYYFTLYYNLLGVMK